MTIFQDTLALDTHGEGEITDLTPALREAVGKSGIRRGLVHLFVNGSTAATIWRMVDAGSGIWLG